MIGKRDAATQGSGRGHHTGGWRGKGKEGGEEKGRGDKGATAKLVQKNNDVTCTVHVHVHVIL